MNQEIWYSPHLDILVVGYQYFCNYILETPAEYSLWCFDERESVINSEWVYIGEL